MKKASSSSYRTKRRKIQKELELLGDWSNDTLGTETYMYSVQKPIAAEICIDHEGQNLNQMFEDNENNCLNSYPPLHLFSPEVSLNVINAYPSHANRKFFINISPDANSKEELSLRSIKKSLSQWAVNCNVPQVTVNKLLTILKFETPLTFLPKDCRTLLKSKSSKVLNIREVKPGNFYHFGLKKSIIRYSSI